MFENGKKYLPLDNADSNGLAHVTNSEASKWGVVGESLNALLKRLEVALKSAVHVQLTMGLLGIWRMSVQRHQEEVDKGTHHFNDSSVTTWK